MTTETITNAVDWDRISARLQEVMRVMLQDEGRYHDATFYADALRRTFDYKPAEGAYTERLRLGFGLTTEAYSNHLIKGHTVIDRLNREKAEQQVKEMRAEVARVYREARADVAAYLRARCNERTVPSRNRREGVAWAADMIDPSVPKDQYGYLVERASDGVR
jgi:hypothetical protein